MITENKLVKLTYDLYIEGSETGKEELIEQAAADKPLVYIHGIGMMLPSFEMNMENLSAGDSFDFRIAADNAYGEYYEEGVKKLERHLFEIDGKFDSERVFVGNVVPMSAEGGQIVNALVTDITDTHVTIDLNHPLAGEDLHFIGKILEVKEATEEELQMFQKGCGKCGQGEYSCGNECGSCGDECGEGCHGGCYDCK